MPPAVSVHTTEVRRLRRPRASWREEALARVDELETVLLLLGSASATPPQGVVESIHDKLDEARSAATSPRRSPLSWLSGTDLQRATALLDAAEIELLR